MKNYILPKTVACMGAILLVSNPVIAAPRAPAKSSTPQVGVDFQADGPVNLQLLDAYLKHSLKSLLNFVQEKSNKENRDLHENMQLKFAINLLGKYRSQEAARFLVDHVSLQTPGFNLELTPFSSFACVNASIEMGNPSVQEILRRIKPLYEGPEYPEPDLHLFAHIIREVDGDEVGLFRLQQAVKNAQGTHKLNLLNLIEIYQKHETEAQIRAAISTDMPVASPPER